MTTTRHATSLLLACCVLAACQPIGARAPDPTVRPFPAGDGSQEPPPDRAGTNPEPIPVNGVGYVVVNAPINAATRDFLMSSIDRLRAAGAREVDLGINSPGGSIDAAEQIVAYMNRARRDGVTFKAYNLRLVASAATYIFLNAQNRFSAAGGSFLFHAAGLSASSPALINSKQLRDSADQLDAYERLMRATLAAHTRLSPAEAQTYVRRTVVLSADDARRDGVVDAIADFHPPENARAFILTVQPPAPAR